MIVSRTTSRPSPEGRRRPFVTLSRSTRRSSTNTGAHLARGRRDVAEHPSLRVDEDNAVPGRVAGVMFHFLSGNRDAAPEGNGVHGAMPGDDGDVVVALDLEVIGLIGVGFAAARYARMVGLFQAFEPLLDPRIQPFPLAAVTVKGIRGDQQRPHDCEKGSNNGRLHDTASIRKGTPLRLSKATSNCAFRAPLPSGFAELVNGPAY